MHKFCSTQLLQCLRKPAIGRTPRDQDNAATFDSCVLRAAPIISTPIRPLQQHLSQSDTSTSYVHDLNPARTTRSHRYLRCSAGIKSYEAAFRSLALLHTNPSFRPPEDYDKMPATAQQVISSLQQLTQKYQNLQAPAQSITILNGPLLVIGQGPYPV